MIILVHCSVFATALIMILVTDQRNIHCLTIEIGTQ